MNSKRAHALFDSPTHSGDVAEGRPANDLDAEDDGAGLVMLTAETGGERLDKYLAVALPEFSRSRLKDLILAGRVSVAGAPCADPSRKLKAGDALTISTPEPEAAAPAAENIPLVVVHEDDDLLVIDKPAGMVVHPAAGHGRGTLVNALLFHCGASLSGIGGVKRPGIVHRLDKDTSGLLVAAKNDLAHRGLSLQFADHGRTGPLERLYRAIVWGEPSRRTGTVDAPIDRSPSNREKMAVCQPGRGREAITHWDVAERFTGVDGATAASLIACALETGRTHQIRVHLAHIGHPLLGDPLYGAGFNTKAVRLAPAARTALDGLGRQALHAAVLGFEHPRTGDTLRFESEPPADMRALIDALADGEQLNRSADGSSTPDRLRR